MTANDFYRFCALGYEANQYKGTDLCPRRQYELHADGRDEGLGEINQNSAEAFHNWLHDESHMGGHPWEVCRGGNSTHVSLQVVEDEKGYYLFLDGSSEGRCIETIKFFLTLKHEQIPVFIADAQKLIARLNGSEDIGIVPDGVIPRYCSSMFPEGDVIDYMNLPYENRGEIVSKARWDKLIPIFLASESEHKCKS